LSYEQTNCEDKDYPTKADYTGNHRQEDDYQGKGNRLAENCTTQTDSKLKKKADCRKRQHPSVGHYTVPSEGKKQSNPEDHPDLEWRKDCSRP
jgi:hypothetical protein